MTDHFRLVLEIGPKGRKVVAVAPDWPGLERGAKTGEDSIERLRSNERDWAKGLGVHTPDGAMLTGGG